VNPLAALIDAGVVAGKDALRAIAWGRFVLEEVAAALVETANPPVGVGEQTVAAGLVGGLGELPVATRAIRAFGHAQAGELCGAVAALRLIGEPIAERADGLLDHRGEIAKAGHGSLPGQGQPDPGQCTNGKQNVSCKLTLQNARLNLSITGPSAS